MCVAELYEPRPVRPLGVRQLDDWRIKVYAITYRRAKLSDALRDAALERARARLPRPAVTASRPGAGFLGIHEGRDSNFAFLDWWADENELHHHVWFSAPHEPGALREWTPQDAIACVWDLAVVGFERAAWVRHVLANPVGPDLDAYLADVMNADV